MEQITMDLIGWRYEQTGGGCDAYIKTLSNGWDLYLTTDTGPDAPETMDDPAILTWVDTAGDVQYQREYPSVTLALEDFRLNER
jgi:hypothetical protein